VRVREPLGEKAEMLLEALERPYCAVQEGAARNLGIC
jgi:hypothetical protein